jgi:hypothetical protein
MAVTAESKYDSPDSEVCATERSFRLERIPVRTIELAHVTGSKLGGPASPWCAVNPMSPVSRSRRIESAWGRVAPGRYRPGAPTDPYVPTLEHTVPRPTGSPSTDGPRSYSIKLW